MKILGLTFIFLCTTSVGIYMSYKTKTSVKQLYETICFIKHIKNQIEFFNPPLSDIYQSFEPKTKAFEYFLSIISSDSWDKALEKSEKLYFSENTVKMLTEYGKAIGKTNRQEQILNCDYYIQQLENEYKEVSIKAPEKIKLNMSVSIYIALMIVILFI